MKKRVLFVLLAASVALFAFTGAAHAKYAGYKVNDAYLSWTDANAIYGAINATTTAQLSPHGGYTQTTVKCAVCHSTHRAYSNLSAPGVGTDYSLLNGAGGSCVQCHAAWGASPSGALVEVGQTFSGPHIGAGGSSCTNRGCHGSVHGIGADTKYAVVAKYNLANEDATITAQIDAAIAAGNTNAQISTSATGDAMKALATGYVCSPCHGNSTFAVATRGYASEISIDSTVTMATGHPSATGQFYGHAPTCEKCHDLVGVATNSTAFPHANRGIDVYKGRFDYNSYNVFATDYNSATLYSDGVIPTTNTDATRYSLWMTSSTTDATTGVLPIVDKGASGSTAGLGYSLQDGACLKCHTTDPADEHVLP
jgi:hypothetical protein